MAQITNREQLDLGPQGWVNWRASLSGTPLRAVRGHANRILHTWTEYALYSDAPVSGEIALGPYQVLNTIAHSQHASIGEAKVVLVLRACMHVSDLPDSRDLTKESVADYHGGDLSDELSALVALAVGRRLRSGGTTRRGYGNDERGTPSEFEHHPPALVGPLGRAMLPAIAEGFELGTAETLLSTYPNLGLNDARTLVRAARQFEEALWLADADPRIAWIKLIGAAEVAASRWDRKNKTDPVARLKTADPQLAQYVSRFGDEAVGWVAKHLADSHRMTDKFIRFTCEFAPGPPESRPVAAIFDWGDLEPALRVIYNARSRDLHDGTPFPGPLCAPPEVDADGRAYERPRALAVAGHGGQWPAEKLPMYLHLFAFIVGGALREWWRSLGPGQNDSPHRGNPCATGWK